MDLEYAMHLFVCWIPSFANRKNFVWFYTKTSMNKIIIIYIITTFNYLKKNFYIGYDYEGYHIIYNKINYYCLFIIFIIEWLFIKTLSILIMV